MGQHQPTRAQQKDQRHLRQAMTERRAQVGLVVEPHVQVEEVGLS